MRYLARRREQYSLHSIPFLIELEIEREGSIDFDDWLVERATDFCALLFVNIISLRCNSNLEVEKIADGNTIRRGSS